MFPETEVSKEVNKEFRAVSVNRLFCTETKINEVNPEASNAVKLVLPPTPVRETQSEMSMELTIESLNERLVKAEHPVTFIVSRAGNKSLSSFRFILSKAEHPEKSKETKLYVLVASLIIKDCKEVQFERFNV